MTCFYEKYLTEKQIYNIYNYHIISTYNKGVTVDDILTVAKASEYCRVSSKTIINWVEAGHIEAYKTVPAGGIQQTRR